MPITVAPEAFYGHQFQTRKVVVAFMDWISQTIYVERYDDQGAILKYIKPPINFAQRERFVQIITGNSQSKENSDYADSRLKIDLNQVLPRMAVDIVGFAYDPDRGINKYEKVISSEADSTTNKLKSIISPVPYNLDLELSIMTKSLDDLYQIIEQILPYFKPSFSLNVNIISPNLFAPDSISFSLVSVNPEADDELGIADDRLFTGTLTFTAKMYYYFFKQDANLIRNISANFNNLNNDGTFTQFTRYQIDAQNLTPVTTIASRDLEPTDTIIQDKSDLPVRQSVTASMSGMPLSLIAGSPTIQNKNKPAVIIGTLSIPSVTIYKAADTVKPSPISSGWSILSPSIIITP